jgi:ABC-type transporter lipoprotein component MlaA
MSREIMQQALDALKLGGLIKKTQAIAALEAELAKPEQEPVNNDYVDIHCPSCLHSFAIAPLRKKWVGLTQFEINRSISNLLENDTDPLMTLAYVIEAKLKEKNS